MDVVLGCDISYYQGDVNFVKMQDAGAGFVIARKQIGYYGDTRFFEYAEAADKVGLPLGAYGVPFPGYNMTRQYAKYIEGISPDDLVFPPFPDVEKRHNLTRSRAVSDILDYSYALKNWWGESVIYCVSVATPILTRDLRWVSAGDLEVGDGLWGFDEATNYPTRKRRYWNPAVVTHSETVEVSGYAIYLRTGEVLYATGEHKWLMDSGDKGARWIQTNQIERHLAHHSRVNNLVMLRYQSVFEHKQDYATGFLAAAFDGEGCLAINNGSMRLSFVQKPNAMLDETQRCLISKGFQWRIHGPAEHSGCYELYLLGGYNEITRFLGEIRPPRLLDVFSRTGLEHSLITQEHVAIDSIESVDKLKIQRLSSSTKTYIAQGFAAHNTAKYVWQDYYSRKKGWIDDWELWVANYTTAPQPHYIPIGWEYRLDGTPVAKEDSYIMWQFSADGNNRGAEFGVSSRDIDLNRMDKSFYDRYVIDDNDPDGGGVPEENDYTVRVISPIEVPVEVEYV